MMGLVRPAVSGWSLALLRSIRRMGWDARLGVSVIVLYAIAAIFAPVLAPYGEASIVGEQFEAWSGAFPFGTDNLGRDVLSRLIFGIRNTIGISLAATLLAAIFGGGLGLLVAAVGGWLDALVSRIVDVLMAVPQLIFALLLLAIVGTSIPMLIVVIAAIEATRLFRFCRALGMDIAAMDFVDIARLRGETRVWIAAREILPNVVETLGAEFALRFCFVFLLISALSFIGLGIQPPTADLGSMVRDNASLITYGDITPLLPAGAIGLLTIAVNFVADWVLQGTSRSHASR
jgi:peptide/nickel transport system permease protein